MNNITQVWLNHTLKPFLKTLKRSRGQSGLQSRESESRANLTRHHAPQKQGLKLELTSFKHFASTAPTTGQGQYVFPSLRARDRPMSENTINGALRRLGFGSDEMTGHGFRAMARTILDEVLGFRPDYIDHQLAHAVRDPNGRAYNRTAHLPERRKMMQSWADYLDKLKVGADVIPLREVV